MELHLYIPTFPYLKDRYYDGLFSDATITVETKVFKVHKVVVSVSRYLEAAFRNDGNDIKLDVKYNIFRYIIETIYGLKPQVPVDCQSAVLKLVGYLIIRLDFRVFSNLNIPDIMEVVEQTVGIKTEVIPHLPLEYRRQLETSRLLCGTTTGLYRIVGNNVELLIKGQAFCLAYSSHLLSIIACIEYNLVFLNVRFLTVHKSIKFDHTITAIATHNSYIVVGLWDGHICIVNDVCTNKRKISEERISCILWKDEVIIAGSWDGKLYFLTKKLEIIQQKEIGNSIYSVILLESRLFVSGKNFGVIIFENDEKIWKQKCEEHSFISIANGYLIIYRSECNFYDLVTLKHKKTIPQRCYNVEYINDMWVLGIKQGSDSLIQFLDSNFMFLYEVPLKERFLCMLTI